MRVSPLHGVNAYRKGCRCVVCREANAAKLRRWRSGGIAGYEPRVGFLNEPAGIDCRCGERIVPCDGRWSDWKHVETNREQCADGEYALPASDAWRSVPCR